MTSPKAGEIYRHFKGNLYEIVALATHTETEEQLVIYKALYGEQLVYARPLTMFVEEVDKEKYPDAGQKFRFEKAEQTQADGVSEAEVNPRILEFLDADSYEAKLEALAGMHDSITDDMITLFAAAVDTEIEAGPLEKRYEELRSCLLMHERFEGSRLR